MFRFGALLLAQLLIVLVIQSGVDTNTRLLVAHAARLTLEIPANWQFLYNPSFSAYGDVQGFVIADPVLRQGNVLSEVCDWFSQETIFFGSEPVIVQEFIEQQTACKIIPSEDQPSTVYGFPTRKAVGLVIEHPTPFVLLGQEVRYVGLVIDAAHFDTISQSISFDPEKVTATAYLEGVLDFVETNAYYGSYLDWNEIRAQMLGRLRTRSSMAVIPNMLLELVSKLKQVGDRHSRYWTAEAVQKTLIGAPRSDAAPSPFPQARHLDKGIAYLELYPTAGIGGFPGESQYVAAAHDAIRQIDSASTRCWIVDLRQDMGGSVDPMLVSLEPLLGDGPAGGFELPNDEHLRLTLTNGIVFQNNIPRSQPYVKAIYQLQHSEPPIAMLIGRNTASAGEQTLLALVGRPQTRTFGERTAGLTVGNTTLFLYDGSALAIAGAAGTDRNGKAYTGSIEPDVFVRAANQMSGTDNDPTLQAAQDWLLSLKECK